MASGRIKGITIEIGGDTTKLDKALAGTDKQLRATQTNLKDVERLLKMDPGNVDLLTQKQRLLTDAVAGTKERLGTLEAAAEQANQQLAKGEISQQQFDALNREIIETKMRLDEVTRAADEFDIGKAVQDAQSALSGLGGEASGAAGDLGKLGSAAGGADGDVNGLGGAASGAEGDVGGLGGAASGAAGDLDGLGGAASGVAGDLDGLGGAASGAAGDLDGLGDAAGDADGKLGGLDGASGGLSGGLGGLQEAAVGAARHIGEKLVDAAIGAAKWIWSLDEATEEYRVAMGKLNTAYEATGLGAETANEAYEGFYKILGDTDTATEAAQLLSHLARNEQDVSQWTEIAAGVYGSFGDSIPIEGLIEAVNETANVGKVTGVLADALNWVGISEDKFNGLLEATGSEGERAGFIMATLANEYRDAAAAFYENNQVLLESREVQMQMDETQAQLGESVAELKNKFFEVFGPTLIAAMQGAEGVLSALLPIIEKIGEALDWLGEKIQGVIGFFQDLFGAGQQASSISVDSGTNSRIRTAETPYALRTASAEDLPYLARGTVTRPNSPFLAVVGDNPTEPEVVSPLSTMRQAVRDELSAASNMRSSAPRNANVTLVLNGTVLGRVLVPLLDDYNGLRGVDLTVKK